ncbi:MAG: glycosyl hydrolase [Candidatus Eisenbacteria bacterium]|uniref:Glycosyl hydrolase n=1 Tax=Eiseniibacteriota bacterium TaxID=2212470 RepID=A0A849SXY6_UNCEI|nr:glycosyl hydrolase [Candidatus Eisenbacteria bacterium]
MSSLIRTAVCVLALAVLHVAAEGAPTSKAAEGGKSKGGKSTAPEKPMELKPETWSGLAFRGIGPALTSGRIGDLAIHPSDLNTWYVAACSGNLWKTSNRGTTWAPIFDKEGSYSIGCVTIDPNDPLVVWVGSGENNSQRSVGYGDGVYRSTDGGVSWKNVGLKSSEHIGRIVVHPSDSRTVYVAAQGPLWSAGGDRGLYRTTDSGETWERILEVDAWTGVNEVHLDPRNPKVMYASTYQRHRRVWTLVNGGPGSGIHKSTDAGKSWTKLTTGLPATDMGRPGLAISPVDPDVVYAIIDAAQGKGGFFRSRNAGASWEKMGDYGATSPQYYNEIVADPQVRDRVYSLDTWMQVSEDGGKTFRRLGEESKHVDNHAMWIDPADNEHLLVGCDGGLYESYDRGKIWSYFSNLPITQFYKICVDEAEPFYNIYGGTQDNNTQGGPSRTNTVHGIRSSDWFITVGGDGFQPRVDPTDPNIVYSQWQHGQLVRFDRRNGEALDIQPQPEPGEPGLRWNWDSPLIISPHSHTRLYFAANRLYRTDDRGDTWRPVSPDLTRQIDRNRLEIMGRVWSVDAPSKNASTSFYGNLVALSESPKREGLLYVGSDDGLVQVSEDAGSHWRRAERFPGVPEITYVSRLEASQHDENVVYAAFDAHKIGDFKPYVLRSDDRGRSWTSIAGDLPERGTVYALAEDHVDRNLLFAGTEFGVFFTRDGGRHWVQLKGGIPTICVRDLAIQKRENDLVVGTFGRGYYVLDDYSPLRHATLPYLTSAGGLTPVKRALMYVPSSPNGGDGKAEMGENFFVAPNPPFGAIFTYRLRDELKSRRDRRRADEKKLAEAGKSIYYPSWDSLGAEDREEAPSLILTVGDSEGRVVRRLSGPTAEGFHRVAWDFTYPAATPTDLNPTPPGRYSAPTLGPPAAPGEYTVALSTRIEGVETPLGPPQKFTCAPLGAATLPATNAAELLQFRRRTAEAQRAVRGALRSLAEAESRVSHLKKAIDDTPAAPPTLARDARALEARLRELRTRFNGDEVRRSRNEPDAPSLVERLDAVVYSQWSSTASPTATQRRAVEIVAQEFAPLLETLRGLVRNDLSKLENAAEQARAPWTPGRLPEWKP